MRDVSTSKRCECRRVAIETSRSFLSHLRPLPGRFELKGERAESLGGLGVHRPGVGGGRRRGLPVLLLQRRHRAAFLSRSFDPERSRRVAERFLVHFAIQQIEKKKKKKKSRWALFLSLCLGIAFRCCFHSPVAEYHFLSYLFHGPRRWRRRRRWWKPRTIPRRRNNPIFFFGLGVTARSSARSGGFLGTNDGDTGAKSIKV